jgi:molecular chaperone IbpA
LYRTTVGFDRLASLLASASRAEQGSYPPYNIQALDENRYRVTMAVAGFSEDELEINTEQNVLTVSGKRPEDESEEKNYLHRGIATRAFERRFNLADHVRVTGASLANGLLGIELEREVPEAMRPRRIEIGSGKGRLLNLDKQDKAA